MEDLEFWDVGEAGEGSLFRRDYTDASGTLWITFLSHNENTGVVYLVGVQTRE